MKLAIIVLLFIATTAYAACNTTTIIGPDGKVTICTTCCDPKGSNCTVTCF